jgi:type 2A phosphatase activator TIP41
MTFGNNSLDLEYTPKGVPQPLSLKFTSLAALAGVASGEGWEERVGGGVQVAMAESWSQNR